MVHLYDVRQLLGAAVATCARFGDVITFLQSSGVC